MSDFLNKFSKENYDKEKLTIEEDTVKATKEEPKTSPESIDEPLLDGPVLDETDVIEDSVEEPIESIQVDEKPIEKSKPKETLKTIRKDDTSNKDDGIVEIDPEYQRKKRKKQIFIGVGAAALLLIAGLTYYFVSYINLPDFSDKPVSELYAWAKDQKMDVKTEEVFTIEKDINVIVEQKTTPNKKIKRGSTVHVIISKGGDPDEKVALPDFKTMNNTTINQWITDYRMDNLKVIYEYSDTVKKDDFIKVEIRDKDVTPETFKRKNGANIYISKGPETFEANIKVPNFKDKTEVEVKAWATEQKLVHPVSVEEDYDDKIQPGMIISQSISPDTMIAKDAKFSVVVSKGKAIYVPNYAGTTLNSFDTLSTEGVNAKAQEWYSTSVAYGTFLEQSIGAGTNISEDPSAIVMVYYSVGKPYLPDLRGANESSLAKTFYDFSEKGAHIQYTVNYDKPNACQAKGTVMRVSKYEQFISMSDHIYLTVSNGEGLDNCPIE